MIIESSLFPNFGLLYKTNSKKGPISDNWKMTLTNQEVGEQMESTGNQLAVNEREDQQLDMEVFVILVPSAEETGPIGIISGNRVNSSRLKTRVGSKRMILWVSKAEKWTLPLESCILFKRE